MKIVKIAATRFPELVAIIIEAAASTPNDLVGSKRDFPDLADIFGMLWTSSIGTYRSDQIARAA